MRWVSISAVASVLGCGPPYGSAVTPPPPPPPVAEAPPVPPPPAEAPPVPPPPAEPLQVAQPPPAPPAPLPTGEHGCAEGRYHRFSPPHQVAPAAELHVIGVYEGQEVQGKHGVEPRSRVAVHVARPGRDVVLVLAAYDPVDWTITAEAGTRLTKVILSGYHAQRAIAPPSVPLDIYGYDDQRPLSGGDSYAGYEWPSVRADQLVKSAESLAGLPLASFRGCYRSAHFVIAAEAPTPEQRPAGGPLAKCAHVLREKRRCMALAGFGRPQVVAVGLDSGTACAGPAVGGVELSGNSSLGWIGDRLYACARERGVVEIAVADGATRIAPVGCEAVTSVGKSLLVMPSMEHGPRSGVERYASFDDLRAGKRAEELQASGHASRFAARGQTGYYAWHSTGEIQLVPLVPVGSPAARAPSVVKLDGYDDWIFGLDALTDGTLIVGSPSRTRRDIRMFDGKTGAQLRSISLGLGRGGDIAGLKCEGP